ncbi:MAG: NADH-quinone oxidoreductase subunit N [Actinomycetota bacterium]|nr:NADH-quinone oxidoreductase subunit N [Actinomycetota bacterium]
MQGYWHLVPEALVLSGALLALFGEFLPGRDRGTALIGAVLAAIAGVLVVVQGSGDPFLGGMLQPDAQAAFIRAGAAGVTALWLLWLSGRGMSGERSRDAVALAMFSASGGMLMAMSADLITLYMALELSTMPAYVLMGYRRGDERGLEGALKYFLLSLLTSLIMLYGLSFVYGISGTTLFSEISLAGSGALGAVAALLVLAGLFAKMSAAPFHFWAPDAYAGAPAASVAFVSTVPKIAGTAAMVRLIAMLAPGVEGLATVIAIVAAASMLLGNLAALPQGDMRRLMAYSGVAHSGYLVMAFAAGTPLGYHAAIFYAVAYAVPSLAIMLVVAEEGDRLDDLGGLAARRPWVAWGMVVWLLSLIGIPPLAGFFGKLYLFSAAIDAAWYWLVVVALIASVISAGYYFRLIHAMFSGTRENPPAEETAPTPAASLALMLAAVATVAVGVAAGPLLGFLGL